MKQETTFVLLKPDCFERNLQDEITVHIFKRLRSTCLEIKDIVATESQIFDFCKSIIEKRGEEVKKYIKERYVGFPVRIIVLQGNNIIKRMKDLAGNSDPEKADSQSIRGIYGEDSLEMAKQQKRIVKNLLTCSDSQQEVERWLKIWLPEPEYRHLLEKEGLE